ncbi:MAG: DUF1624 domain-containing protein [Cellvibrionales bacterium]|nr:DUF1624 domain-containing protein [Cellvibrionales bacterium]
MPPPTARIQWVDSLRGTAIVLMVIFHFCYDLRHFGWVDWDVPNGPNWWPFRYLILTLFIFTMGLSLSLAHGNGFRPRQYATRLLHLALAAAAVTAMSLILFPNSWIYFGILHFLLAASLLTLPLVAAPRTALALAALVLILYGSGTLSSTWPFAALNGLPAHTEDYVPLVPWTAIALLGIAAGRLLPLPRYQTHLNWLPTPLAPLGRHSLLIYLTHQPILFAAFYLVETLR